MGVETPLLDKPSKFDGSAGSKSAMGVEAPLDKRSKGAPGRLGASSVSESISMHCGGMP